MFKNDPRQLKKFLTSFAWLELLEECKASDPDPVPEEEEVLKLL